MVIVTTAVYWGLNSPLHPHDVGPQLLVTFQHRAGVSPYTSTQVFARTCVFSKQSLSPSLCDHPTPTNRKDWRPKVAPHLPKLRGQFAEFLNHSSPASLSILNPTTSVGFGYGQHHHSLRGFSRQHRITTITTQKWLRITPHPICAADLPTTRATRLHPHNQPEAWLPHCVTPSLGYHASGPTPHPAKPVIPEGTTSQDAAQLVSTLHHKNAAAPVREYQPVSHRLRPTASP